MATPGRETVPGRTVRTSKSLVLDADKAYIPSMAKDPVETNPANYRVAFENERVRVLEYIDSPGHRTTEHSHPDSVMITVSGFRRRISSNGNSVEVELPAGVARWLPAQQHSGENIGATDTHTFFVELKESVPASNDSTEQLGPRES
jgi:beta-alanine degradation protein BauB